jgi:disease resistance protein RPM1
MSTTCTRTPGATSSSSQASWRAFEQENVRDVGEVPPEQLSEVVKVWARDAREVSYDMEDIVDTFLVRVQGTDSPISKRSRKMFVKEMMGFVTLL